MLEAVSANNRRLKTLWCTTQVDTGAANLQPKLLPWSALHLAARIPLLQLAVSAGLQQAVRAGASESSARRVPQAHASGAREVGSAVAAPVPDVCSAPEPAAKLDRALGPGCRAWEAQGAQGAAQQALVADAGRQCQVSQQRQRRLQQRELQPFVEEGVPCLQSSTRSAWAFDKSAVALLVSTSAGWGWKQSVQLSLSEFVQVQRLCRQLKLCSRMQLWAADDNLA